MPHVTPPRPTITGPRLHLTLLTPATLEPALHDLHELRTYESVMRWTRAGVVDASLDATRDWALMRMRKPGCEQYLVQLRAADDDRPVKTIGALGIVTPPEIGYLMNPQYQGKGYATEAVSSFLAAFWEYAEAEGGGPVAYARAEIDATNSGSRRVLQKCGFQKVAEGREGVIMVEKWMLPRPGTTLTEAK